MLKITPWLLILCVAFAYALPTSQKDEDEQLGQKEGEHVHDEHCGHPIKDFFEGVKKKVGSAFEKTKSTIGKGIQAVKNTFGSGKDENTKKPTIPSEQTDVDIYPTDPSAANNPTGFSPSYPRDPEPTPGRSSADDLFNAGLGGNGPVDGVRDANTQPEPSTPESGRTLTDDEISQAINPRTRSRFPSSRQK